MPAKHRSSRGSRRSGNRDDDQGHLLEPGSSREEDDQRHPHAHTNAPATRTESQEKEDAAQQPSTVANGQSTTAIATIETGGDTCKETGVKLSQSTDCAIPSTSGLQTGTHGVRTKASCSTSALANHATGAQSKSLQSLQNAGPGAKGTPKSRSAKPSPAPSKGPSSNHLDKPENLKKSSSKHSGADSQVSRQSASGTVDGAASTASGVSSVSQKQKTSHPGGRGRQGGGGGSGGTAASAPLQKVVYYQNRFITIPIDPGDRKQCAAGVRIGPGAAVPSERDSGSSAVGRSGSGASKGGGKHGGSKTGGGGAGGHQVKNPGGRGGNPEDMDPNIAAMAGLAPQPGAGPPQSQVIQVAPKPAAKKKKRKTPKVLKKIALCLEDNRMRTGSDETKDKIRSMNESQDSTNMILKKILNIILVTTGITLFLSVVIVIIYTSIAFAGYESTTAIPAPAGWETNDPMENSIETESIEGKPGSNPGDYEIPAAHVPVPSRDVKPVATSTVITSTEQDRHVNRLEPEDEDHEYNPTLPPEFNYDFDFGTYENGDYYGGVYPIGPELPVHYGPIKPPTPKSTTTKTTTPPTTTTTAPDDFFKPYYDPFENEDNNFLMGTFEGDAYKQHRLFLKQKLREKQRLYKFHRRRHRHHRHRGSS